MALVVLSVDSKNLPPHTAAELIKWLQDELNMIYDQANEIAYGNLKGQELSDIKIMRVIES